jgi:hypothetical protein
MRAIDIFKILNNQVFDLLLKVFDQIIIVGFEFGSGFYHLHFLFYDLTLLVDEFVSFQSLELLFVDEGDFRNGDFDFS